MIARLVHTGNVVHDLVLEVDALPERGGDALARHARGWTGGAFNTMAAARRLGLATAYAGLLGTGPRAAQAADDLAAEGIVVSSPPVPDDDTGLVICLVDREGERTFVTLPGAEVGLRREHLERVAVTAADAVVVSGYSLVHGESAATIVAWLGGLPPETVVVLDPGPLVDSVPTEVLVAVLARCDWLCCNRRELGLLAAGSWERLRDRLPRGGLLVRGGADGAWVAPRGEPPAPVAAYAVDVVDTNGAGDTHTGAFVAGLAEGRDPIAAADRANAAAAWSIARRGPATSPRAADLAAILDANRECPRPESNWRPFA